MHFCSKCDNMYYIYIPAEDPNKLVYYCRKCGNTDDMIGNQNISVYKTQVKSNEKAFDHFINKYTKLDNTLPRTSKILCPNPKCETNTKNEKREIISIRYDDINIKYAYICSTCDTVWKVQD